MYASVCVRQVGVSTHGPGCGAWCLGVDATVRIALSEGAGGGSLVLCVLSLRGASAWDVMSPCCRPSPICPLPGITNEDWHNIADPTHRNHPPPGRMTSQPPAPGVMLL